MPQILFLTGVALTIGPQAALRFFARCGPLLGLFRAGCANWLLPWPLPSPCLMRLAVAAPYLLPPAVCLHLLLRLCVGTLLWHRSTWHVTAAPSIAATCSLPAPAVVQT